jgi:hypothetical protein
LAIDATRSMKFTAEIQPQGEAVIRAVVSSDPDGLNALTVVPGSLPEPYRRRPEPVSADHPRGQVDLSELERLLRAFWPDAAGMTDAEIDAAEQRLGVEVPPEARVLFRVIREYEAPEIYVDEETSEDTSWRVPIPFDVWALDAPRRARRRADRLGWDFLALTAGTTPRDSPVQALSQPDEWFVLGQRGGMSYAIDMAPGPSGKVGQIIGWFDANRGNHPFGAWVLADSLLDFVVGRRQDGDRGVSWTESLPEYGEISGRAHRHLSEVISPELEVLQIFAGPRDPVTIAPLVGLPRLRTLAASRGSIADPEQIGRIETLEFLRLEAPGWTALLDAHAVPPGLHACEIGNVFDDENAHEVAEVKERLRAHWSLEPSEQILTIHGDLGPIDSDGAAAGSEREPAIR